MNLPKTHLINEASRCVGLSQKRIREYEQAGLIKPRREPRTNNRLYTEADIRRIRRVKQLIHEHGFTLAGLQYLLSTVPCWTIFHCTRTASCPAYQTPHTNCYDIMKATDCFDSHGCSQCAVYLNRHGASFALFEKV